ncbi:DUF1642 domain-containing protein [Enterococcus durans]|uniref:DUF1642 domain-containing protein n=1 Tax=Enterococcus durans TaxID=53345 RepID=UPI0011BF963B|nr:DUF1642 domain-containing protein [Enterococcus durans]QED60867.1 DUF1642 domain-containing protein [Enterococcus durans]QED63459.1 DUF1642 domain-containing protein [Enterococcus durans]
MKAIEDIIHELNLKCTALNTNSVTIEQTDENDEFKCNSHVSDFNKGKIEGLSEAKKLLEEVKQLDEPQKPVVPKFLDEYIKDNEGQHAADIFSAEWLYEESGVLEEKVAEWLLDDEVEENNRRYLIAVQAFVTGDYEVEKEPLYYVYFPEIIASPDLMDPDIEGAYLMKNGDEVELADNNSFDEMKFTESEIKAIDERYWAFAVPVEEVAE